MLFADSHLLMTLVVVGGGGSLHTLFEVVGMLTIGSMGGKTARQTKEIQTDGKEGS